MQLELGQDQLQKYKPLLHEQLKISTAISNPNAQGQQNYAWNAEFYLSSLASGKGPTGLIEERNNIGPIGDGLDMGNRMWELLVKHLLGHACYLGRQFQIYSLLAQDAQAAFQDLQTILNQKFESWELAGSTHVGV
ncbi:hypothetical protein EDB19DRAFT_1822955 [Suillus lakei]|nr:hypothetical protein EDB19DRAFT_1822955 [Suillus lakei]